MVKASAVPAGSRASRTNHSRSCWRCPMPTRVLLSVKPSSPRRSSPATRRLSSGARCSVGKTSRPWCSTRRARRARSLENSRSMRCCRSPWMRCGERRARRRDRSRVLRSVLSRGDNGTCAEGEAGAALSVALMPAEGLRDRSPAAVVLLSGVNPPQRDSKSFYSSPSSPFRSDRHHLKSG